MGRPRVVVGTFSGIGINEERRHLAAAVGLPLFPDGDCAAYQMPGTSRNRTSPEYSA